MAFMDLTFQRGIAANVTGGPERRVDIVSLSSGEEERNARWKHSRRSYDAGMGIRDADDLLQVISLFEEVGGQLHSFRFRDWQDFTSAQTTKQAPRAIDQVIGTGDGITTEFQLVKVYGSLSPYTRPITKPISGTVKIAVNSSEVQSGWTVDPLTGIVSFDTAPAASAIVSAGFKFDVPVRFDTPRLTVDMAFFSEDRGEGVGTIPEIPLIEVKE